MDIGFCDVSDVRLVVSCVSDWVQHKLGSFYLASPPGPVRSLISTLDLTEKSVQLLSQKAGTVGVVVYVCVCVG